MSSVRQWLVSGLEGRMDRYANYMDRFRNRRYDLSFVRIVHGSGPDTKRVCEKARFLFSGSLAYLRQSAKRGRDLAKRFDREGGLVFSVGGILVGIIVLLSGLVYAWMPQWDVFVRLS